MSPRPPEPRRRLAPAIALLYLASLAAAYLVSERRAPSADGAGLSLLKSKPNKIGWVRIHGPIFESDGRGLFPTGIRAWVQDIHELGERDDVKAIVLDISSPGGSVGAVQEVYSEIERVRKEKKKPFVAVMGDVAASGGYYLAAACDKIVAHPGTITGSIGVIFETGNVEGLLKKIGVSVNPIKSGLHKDIGSPTRTMTPEERELLQGVIDDAYHQFFAAVKDGRKLSEEKLQGLADGRIFTGQQAVGLGLVDQLGDSRDAAKLAGTLGGIKGEPEILENEDSFEGLRRLLDSKTEAPSLLSELGGSLAPRLEYRWAGY
jgi:protease IV